MSALRKPKRQLILPSRPDFSRRKLPDGRLRAPWIWVPRIIPVRAAVAVDVTGTETLSASAASPHTYTGLTTGVSLSNGAVTFTVIYDTQVTGSAATWDGVACALVASANTTGTVGRVEKWALSPIGTHTGAKTFSVSWTGGGNAQTAIVGLSWTGVDQTGGTTSFPNGTSNQQSLAAGTQTQTVTVTSATGDAAVAGFVGLGTLSAPNQTSIYIDNGPTNMSASASRAAGAISVVFNITTNSGAPQAVVSVGVDIKAAAAGDTLAGSTNLLMM